MNSSFELRYKFDNKFQQQFGRSMQFKYVVDYVQ